MIRTQPHKKALSGSSEVAQEPRLSTPTPIEPVVWPPRSPSEQLLSILRRGLESGESLVGPGGRWAVHG